MKLRNPTRMTLSSVLPCLLVMASGGVAHAQDTGGEAARSRVEAASRSGPSRDDILVTGYREGDDAAIDDFVETLLAETANRRVARWSDRICLNIEGGSVENGRDFAERIAEVASEVGVAILPERRCVPSAYIVFTSEPDRLLDQLREARPAFFGSIAPSQRDAFEASDSPVRWVSHADVRGPQGETPMSFYTDPKPTKPAGALWVSPAMRATPSRLVDGTRMDLQAMLVVVDVSKLSGISYLSLSAYLAMVVLGNVRPDHGEVGRPSILDMFDTARRTGEVYNSDLSDWDVAYLRSLYQGNWNMTSDRRLRQIQASMARNLRDSGGEVANRQ